MCEDRSVLYIWYQSRSNWAVKKSDDMVNSNTVRIEAIEASVAEVNRRVTGIEDTIQQILAEGMANFQKTMAEKFAARSEEENQKNKETMEAAAMRLEGRIDRYREDQTAQMNLMKASQEKFQAEMKELMANRPTAATPQHQEEGAHSEKTGGRTGGSRRETEGPTTEEVVVVAVGNTGS